MIHGIGVVNFCCDIIDNGYEVIIVDNLFTGNKGWLKLRLKNYEI